MNESLEQQCNEFDLRETKARNALSAAGVPDWEPYPNEDVSDHEKSLRSGGRALSVVDRIERLARDLKHARDDEAFAAEHADNCDIRNASMEQQLAAATNDAARAELRAQELAATLRRVKKVVDWDGGEFEHRIDQILAAAPDSDARLREVMTKVADATRDWVTSSDGHDVRGDAYVKWEKPDYDSIIDEVLRGAP